jgi:hypothetical protein
LTCRGARRRVLPVVSPRDDRMDDAMVTVLVTGRGQVFDAGGFGTGV